MIYRLFLFFLLGINPVFSDSITEKNLQKHIQFLCSNTLNGRLIGSVGEKLATRYVADRFRQLGLDPAGDNGTFFQDFSFSSDDKKHQHGRNVLAKLIINPRTTQIIVIGAHIDHLGPNHPGADDNASGVASILEIAGKLSALQKQGKLNGSKNILFAAWSGEELGILGSSYFVKKLLKTTQQTSIHSSIDLVINLDMVGRLQKNLIIQGTGSSVDWQKLLRPMKKKHTLTFITQKDPYLPTDSTAFYLHGVPTLNFFTGAHKEYHSSNDTPETLNYAGIKAISDFLTHFILSLEKIPRPITYHAMAKPNDPADERELRIYLGTIPDYAQSDTIGVPLSGVIKSSPAERAGVQQYDIVIALDGKKIHDIYDYTSALNALTAKKPITIVVVRQQRKKALTIVPVYRS